MPKDPVVWIVVAAVIALVFIIAIVKGKRRLRVTGPGGLSARMEDTERKISVADRVRFENAKVGNVTGSRSEGGAAATNVTVMDGATVKGGQIGDITGEEIKAGPAAPEKDE